MQPLEGLRIVELAQMIAGPSSGQLLADYGADVIKIEPPGGDYARQLRSAATLDGDATPLFTTYNAGKRCVELDLKSPEGAAAAWELIAESDVVIETSRPGATESMGFGYEEVHRRYPHVVYASISGFGWEDEGRQRRAVDLVVQAESGIMSTTGPVGGDPLKVGFTVVDAAAGHALTHGILAGVLQRQHSGEGLHVRCSLYGVAVHLQAAPLAEYIATGTQTARLGNSAPLSAPADMFNCADGQFVISAYTEPHWAIFTRVIGAEELRDVPEFATSPDRVRNRPALLKAIEERLITRSVDEWTSELLAAGLIVGKVRNYESVVLQAPDLVVGLVETIDDAGLIRNPIELGDRAPASIPQLCTEVPTWQSERTVSSV